jgi:hypothetical protein
VIGVHPRQPLVHGEDGLVGVVDVADDRRQAAPEHLVVGGAEVTEQPRSHGVGAVDVVEGTRIRPAQVDDGDLVQVVGRVDGSAGIGPVETSEVGITARRLDVVVVVHPAEVTVEVDELCDRQLTVRRGRSVERPGHARPSLLAPFVRFVQDEDDR